jgi:RES domain
VTGVGPDDTDALPEPPYDLASRRLPIVQRASGDRFVRIHRKADGAIWFGWSASTATFRVATNRFDATDRRYGVLYVAATRDGAFAESVGRMPRVFRSDGELAALRITTLALTRDIRVVDLHGGAAVGAIGATGVVGVGPMRYTIIRRCQTVSNIAAVITPMKWLWRCLIVSTRRLWLPSLRKL